MRHATIKNNELPKTLGSVDWWQTTARPTQNHPKSRPALFKFANEGLFMRHAAIKNIEHRKTLGSVDWWQTTARPTQNHTNTAPALFKLANRGEQA